MKIVRKNITYNSIPKKEKRHDSLPSGCAIICRGFCCTLRYLSPAMMPPSTYPGQLCCIFLCEGETEGHPALTAPNGASSTTTSSTPLGSISGLLEACRCWIWLHSLGPTSANVPPSIHQGGLTAGRVVMKYLSWQQLNEEQRIPPHHRYHSSSSS